MDVANLAHVSVGTAIHALVSVFVTFDSRKHVLNAFVRLRI